MTEIRNEFSWSKSRDEVFLTCPRQYYFNYYGYWGGWKAAAPQRTWQIYMLKNLKNRFMWAGDLVHQCIKHTLKNLQRGISILGEEQIIAITIDRMREEFRSSREKRYRTHPKTCALFEHEYEAGIEDAEWKRTADNVTRCLKNFYGSALFAELKALPQDGWLEIEDFSYFFLNGIKIWAVLDCSFRTAEGVTIVDWKTGRTTREDISLQLSCYAMYAQEHWKIKPERIRLIEYNLLSDQQAEFHISKGEIKNTRSYIRGSVADMQSLLADVNNNIPKDEEFFKKIDDEQIHDRCNFKKVCFP
ncbi:MAG: PD-(D/E)XK nuclease family protein [Thermodesulfobacteriota bacterium]